MLKWAFLVAGLCVALVSSKASGPTIFEDGWSPVHNSQVVDLPKQTQAKSQPAAVVERAPQPVEAPLAKDRVDVNVEEVSPLEEEVENVPLEQELIDRIDVVQERVSSVSGPTGVNNFVDKNVDKHNVESQPTNDYQDEEDEENEEERETAAPPVKHTNVRPDVEETPLIVYPSGTVPQYFGPNDGNRQNEQQQQAVEEEEEEEEVPPQFPQGGPVDGPPQLIPRPPPVNRYQPQPPPPPPGRAPLLQRRPPPQPQNWRRPPPPVTPYSNEEAYPRNVNEEEQPLEAAPRQSPFENGPPRPRPRPENNGGVLGSITAGLSNLGGNIKCAAEDIGADVRLNDEAFMQTQLNCVLDKGPCDELGASVKRLAPDIMRGICPHPCDDCKRGKIQKVMSTIARKYPKQWNEMVREFGRRAQQRQRRRD